MTQQAKPGWKKQAVLEGSQMIWNYSVVHEGCNGPLFSTAPYPQSVSRFKCWDDKWIFLDTCAVLIGIFSF